MAKGCWPPRKRDVSPIENPSLSTTDKVHEGRNYQMSTSAERRFSADYTSFKKYLQSAFRTSLIISFPKIASAKSWKKRTWHTLVFLLCLVGLLYQTWGFLEFYLTYPTTVNVETSSPFKIVQPALTFCSNNILRRKVYCERNRSACTFHEDNELFCEKFPKYCIDNIAYMGVPTFNNVVKETFSSSWNQTFEAAPTEKMIQNCTKIVNKETYTCSISVVPFVTKENKPTVCYSIDSQQQEPDSEENIYPNTFYFSIILDTFPEEYFYHSDPVLIHAVVHDRRQLVNPFIEGFVLRGGYRSIIYVSMTEFIRMPYPYITNCTDYIKLWKENNGTGPLTQLECIEYCKLNKVRSQRKCVDEHISYPHTEDLCDSDVETTTNEMIRDCGLECRPGCLEKTYDIKYDELELDNHLCDPENVKCRSRDIFLKVSFRKFRLASHVYQPKYKSIELFSYIGGYMGMWLGLSLVSILDFVETICHLLYYSVKKIRRKNIEAN